MREDDGHAPGLGGHGFDHVLNPGEVAALGGRHPGEVAAVRIAGPDLVAPLLEREGRIGDDAVEGGEAVAEEKRGAAQGIAAHDLEVRRAVQEKIHAGDGGGGEVFLLTVELAPERAVVAVGFLHMLDALDEHAAGAAGWVVEGLAFAGIEDVHHESHDRARGVELARLLVRGVGELLDEILIRLPQHIRLRRRVPEREPREVLDEILEQRIREPVLVRPLRIAEDAVKRVRICLLDPAHRRLKRLPDIRGHLPHILPVTVLGNLEAVVLREQRRLFIAIELLQRRRVLLVMHIRDALEKQQREHIRLEVGRIHRSAQDVGGLPEVRFKLGEGDGGGGHAVGWRVA